PLLLLAAGGVLFVGSSNYANAPSRPSESTTGPVPPSVAVKGAAIGLLYATAVYSSAQVIRCWYLGGEIVINANLRIAPFGNRFHHPAGRWPHYHRKIIDPKTGQTVPGGSMRWHRPWEGGW